jgi:uncharacterized membrane protein YfcA
MLIGILYFFIIVIVISTSAIAGISGGVVLRPVFDLIGYHSAIEIGFYMGGAVITMTIASTLKQIKMGTKIKLDKVLTLAVGAITGGWVGQGTLEWMAGYFDNNAIQMFQNIMSILVLAFVLIATRPGVKKCELKGMHWYVLAGLGLGAFASILAIGGGPINVVAFTIIFGITLKEATVYSITTILFTQLSRLVTMGMVSGGYGRFELNLLWFIIPAAIIGGYIGGKLNVKFSDQQVVKVFKFVVIGTILINIWNTIEFGLGLIG